jgi:hypothetical protein
MKKILICLSFLFVSISVFCQSDIKILPYFRQGGMYFSSDNITSEGYGMGAGIAIQEGEHLLTEIDMNLFWLNGNAISARLSRGYKKAGKWSPTAMANLSVIYGSHTEVLYDDGSSPEMPAVSIGLKIAPLRFENDKGFVSILEFGYGVGNDNAMVPEITLLALGIRSKILFR